MAQESQHGGAVSEGVDPHGCHVGVDGADRGRCRPGLGRSRVPVRLPQLTATEVQGTRVETFDLYRGELAVSVKINVANSGAPGALVSVTVNEDAEFGGFRTFTLGKLASGDIGTAVPVGDENFLTVTASPTVPLAGPTNEFIVEYAMNGSPAEYRTVTVTFQPDCGAAAVCTIVSYNGPT